MQNSFAWSWISKLNHWKVGIIKRQTIKGTLFTYLGVVIGFVTTALIFPRVLTTDQIGLLGIFMSYSFIFAQLASLGSGRAIVVMFPYFKDREKKHHGFFTLMLAVNLSGLILATFAFFLLRPWLVENANDTSPLLGEYINYLLPLIIFNLFFLFFDSYFKVLYNATRGIILKEFIQRILILVFIVFYIIHLVEFRQYVFLYVLSIGIPPFILLYSLIRYKEFTITRDPDHLTKSLANRIVSISFYGILIGFSGMVILNIDRIMVERMLGLSYTGIYTTMSYFAALIAIPSRALLKISDPVIAQSWKDNNLKELEDNYYRSSLNQFIVGALLLIGIWGNSGNILRILPPDFAPGLYVILFIGLAFLSDMAAGTSGFILANSKYYKYQTYFILMLVIFIVITNYLLIPVWGITGAAVATFISKAINNFLKFFLLRKKFNLQPYNRKYLYVIGISLFAYYLGYIIPEFKNLYLDIFFRSLVIGLAFAVPVIVFRISEDIHQKFIEIIHWLRNRT